jgi:hypothetical protein
LKAELSLPLPRKFAAISVIPREGVESREISVEKLAYLMNV